MENVVKKIESIINGGGEPSEIADKIQVILKESKETKQEPIVYTYEAFKTAINKNDITTVQKILKDHQVDPSADYNYAVRLAALNGYETIVKMLLDDERVDPSDRDNYAVRFAAHHGHETIVKMILDDERVDPSDCDNYAVRWAASNGHKTIVKILLDDERVDPSADHNYAVRWAKRNGHAAIVKMLKDYQKSDDSEMPRFPSKKEVVPRWEKYSREKLVSRFNKALDNKAARVMIINNDDEKQCYIELVKKMAEEGGYKLVITESGVYLHFD